MTEENKQLVKELLPIGIIYLIVLVACVVVYMSNVQLKHFVN